MLYFGREQYSSAFAAFVGCAFDYFFMCDIKGKYYYWRVSKGVNACCTVPKMVFILWFLAMGL